MLRCRLSSYEMHIKNYVAFQLPFTTTRLFWFVFDIFKISNIFFSYTQEQKMIIRSTSTNFSLLPQKIAEI